MGRRVIFDSCHPVERKNSDFAALRWFLRLSGDCHLTERSWMEVGRWRLVSWWIVLFLTTACSSINQR
ncbi:unnamed protein product [Spirodela intermedia]|uniref:Uncharacterized protein n=1 Tax=Spirodela intermedia TaxID=51605 RepID=A0A7I8KW42_SPIIN|nr:unnamed protein product [Spirodela intermedia]